MATTDDIAVLTSENVRLTYTLAGMGSRVAAFLADSLIIGLIGIAVTLVFIMFGMSTGSLFNFGAEGFSLVSALYILAMTFLLWGYYFFFEWINWGQTPGKQLLGIRVSAADGAPANTMACAMRNVIRIIDLMLAFVGVTFFIMIFTPRYQRLGDLAAGTVVVRRRQLSFDEILYAARESDRAIASATAMTTQRMEYADTGPVRIRIDDAERILLDKFIQRRDSLPPNIRRKLAHDLARRIRERVPDDATAHLNDEQVIETALASTSRNNG